MPKSKTGKQIQQVVDSVEKIVQEAQKIAKIVKETSAGKEKKESA